MKKHTIGIVLIIFFLSTVLNAQSASESDMLRNLLISQNCQRACFLEIEPGIDSQFDVISILNQRNIIYTIFYPAIEGDNLNSFYDIYPNTSPFPTIGRTSIIFQNGLVTRIIVPMKIKVSTILTAFGNPKKITYNNSVGTTSTLYYLEYPNLGLIFQIPNYQANESTSVFLTNLSVQNGDFVNGLGDVSVNQPCPTYGTPPCIAPTAIPPSISITSLSLINADTDTSIQALTSGNTLNLGTLPTRNLNIRADASGSPAKVVFTLNGVPFREDTTAPFSFGDTSGNYSGWTPDVGSYTLTATPFNASNVPGTPLTVTFTVTDKLSASATTLRDLLTHPDCEHACFKGIKPGDTLNQVQGKLDQLQIPYTSIVLWLSENRCI